MDRIAAIEQALTESVEAWERGEAASPSTRDFIYYAGRAVGIGTDHADISEALCDEIYEWEIQTTPDLHEYAVHLSDRLS
jgi:hypothetical protein